VHLDAEESAPGRYVVTGGAAPHEVTESATGTLACDCADAACRAGIECKHVLRVKLMRADPAVMAALKDVVPPPNRSRQYRCRRPRTAGIGSCSRISPLPSTLDAQWG
jgi:L-asparaginase II